MAVDCLVIVPFEPDTAAVLDPKHRQTAGAYMAAPLAIATLELESYIGRSLNFWDEQNRPAFGAEPMPFPKHRSLTAVALATALERAGLRWHALDPGVKDLTYWRRELKRFAGSPPKTVALSTTFIMTAPWLRALCALIRASFPGSMLLVGGYYYATNAATFLDLDADVLCVGEGEARLPLIVRRIASGCALDDIPGLYIREGRRGIRHTGPVQPLKFAELSPPDWALASRIDPPVYPERDTIEIGVETQRGCVFKCEFCTYRTLASPSAQNVTTAVRSIMSAVSFQRGFINLADATASYPHDRWDAILNGLVESGGAPHPIWAFTRVSDITDERAALMAQAGVRHVFIGQESGSQTILNKMKKGTKIAHLKPAITALRRAGIGATMGFIHGFPGEDRESIQETRATILALNDSGWRDPTTFAYLLYPFIYMDFAAVSRNSEVTGSTHYLGYDNASISPRLAVEEVLATFIAVSRNPHAPVYAFLFESGPPTTGMGVFCSSQRTRFFEWLKAVERGAAIFLEKELDGRSSGQDELPKIRELILTGYSERSWAARRRTGLRCAGLKAYVRALRNEWRAETAKGCGLLTKASAGISLLTETHSWQLAASGAREGTVPDNSVARLNAAPAHRHDRFAQQLVSEALSPRARADSHSRIEE